MDNISKKISFVLSVLTVSAIFGYTVLAWTEPGSSAPNGTVNAPINTGSIAQGKLGNFGVGTASPGATFDVVGQIRSSSDIYTTGGGLGSTINGDVGGYLSLTNPKKTGIAASVWKLYNMTGGYGDSFQIWDYPANGLPTCCTSRFIIKDDGTTVLSPGGGNVAIGMASPGNKLDVAGNIGLVNDNGQIKLTGSTTYQAGSYNFGSQTQIYYPSATSNGDGSKYATAGSIDLKAQTLSWGGPTNVLGAEIFLEGGKSPNAVQVPGNILLNPSSTGNVGIGTASPGAKLDVVGTSGNDILRVTSSSGGYLYEQYNTAGDYGVIGGYNGGAKSLVINPLGGNLGIGKINPAYALDIKSGSQASQVHLSPSSDDGVYITSVGQSNGIFSAGASYTGNISTWTAKYTSAWMLGGDGGWAALFANSGLTPGQQFTASPRLSVWPNGNVGLGGSDAVNSPVMIVTGAGNVGIGTASPSQKLDISGGNIIERQSMLSGGTYFGMFSTAGNLPAAPSSAVPVLKTDNQYLYFSVGGGTNFGFIDSGGAYHTQSSRSIKENFVQVNPQAILNKIDELPMYQWNYKEQDPQVKHIAPVAEDFYDAFGLGGDNKTIADIDPSGVALVGVKALSQEVKDQQSLIEQLQTDMNSLRSEIKDLKSQKNK